MQSFNASYTGLRGDLLKYIKNKDNVILDVGCATGENGAYLLRNRLAKEVYGIEFGEGMVYEASHKINKVFHGDLNELSFRQKVVDESPLFDYILFGDILEHLVYPEHVFKDICKLLKPDGKVVISVPNISHIELFIQVYIKGTWPLNSRGIFDKTHLRWFTKKDICGLMRNCGIKVVKYERKLRARDSLNSTFNLKYKLIKMINKDWVTFQHILVGTSEQ
ncbi:class I SAM-dependent methyltransferase [Salinimicrobium sp. HB62]|uniref:class I SAM-dependent methyltransferase n=1 Tax=Salinimicrobium sp. HB62 TaxID=3077781 RepID=UPI002D775F3E|nr:class I SAM-dependent methyltransferase [Salinimicrobium sp. HB62]